MSDELLHRLKRQGAHYPELRRLLDETIDCIEAQRFAHNQHVEWSGAEFLKLQARIEELEKTMWGLHGEAHEHIKRIEELELELQQYRVATAALDKLYSPHEETKP